MQHEPLRPLWICQRCAQPWPCGAARHQLANQYATDRPTLAIDLAGRLRDAESDLARVCPPPGPDPAELYGRFLGWVKRVPDA